MIEELWSDDLQTDKDSVSFLLFLVINGQAKGMTRGVTTGRSIRVMGLTLDWWWRRWVIFLLGRLDIQELLDG